MKSFKFKLQKLLDIRMEKEKSSIYEFKSAQVEKEGIKIKLKDLEDSYEKYNRFDINDSSTISQKIKLQYLNALNSHIEDTNIELKDKEKILEEKRVELTKCQVARKTVEVLKDKQKANYINEQNLIEQKNNDEFALFSYIRNVERR
jgi:flagellar protein FliJ